MKNTLLVQQLLFALSQNLISVKVNAFELLSDSSHHYKLYMNVYEVSTQTFRRKLWPVRLVVSLPASINV